MIEKTKNKELWENEIIWIYAQWKWDFWFVDVEWREKGYFVFWRNSLNAMTWDKVFATVKVFKWKEEAEIKKVLTRRKEPIVWVFNDSWRFGFVAPNDPSFKKDIFIPWSKALKAKDGEIVAVEVLSWEGRSPEWKVVKVLWKPWDKWVDVLGLAVEYGARMWFGWAIREELEKIQKPVSIKDINKRKDLRKLFTITIDWEDSKDLDDAVSVEKTSKGNYVLSVHIADVAHYVKEGHAIDKEALRRWTSIYLVDQVIPMLPKELSNGLCSLNPNEDKLTLTCEIEINSAWHIVNTNVYESVIKSDFRMTYKEVDEIIESKQEVEEWNTLLFGWIISKQLISMLQDSEKLRDILALHKKSLGVLEFDFPETKIIVDKDGNPTEFKKYERYNSNKIIEEFMVMANEAISRKFSDIPFLYRVHPKPSEEDVEKLQKNLAIFSYTLPKKDKVSSKDFAVILNEIKNDAREKLLSKMVLRSLTKAIYSDEREWHFGLALDYYSHFTSPIRRYPDLQIHRIIKEKLHKRLDKGRIGHYKLILPKVANKTSDLEVKAEKLSYKIQDLMAVKYMKNKVGEQFDAHISWAIQHWVFVELDNTIEWFVELNEKFWPSNFVFDADMMEMKSSISQVKYSIWDSVKVELIKVDPKLLRLDFALVL